MCKWGFRDAKLNQYDCSASTQFMQQFHAQVLQLRWQHIAQSPKKIIGTISRRSIDFIDTLATLRMIYGSGSRRELIISS